MALFDFGTTLEDSLGRQANNQVNNIENVYAKKRRQSVAQNAHAGRLMSGVSNYDAGDINAQEAGAVGDVYGGLASALGQVPTTDYTASEDDHRNRELAKLLASLSKPSSLEEALGAMGAAGNVAGTFAAFA